MARRPGRRDRIRAAFDEFHGLSSAALGAADRLRDRAAGEHAENLAEMWLREAGRDAAHRDPSLARVLANPRFADVVGRFEADREAAFAPWLRDGTPERLDALVAEAAPGVAGADPAQWLGRVGTTEGTGPVPGLWQLGRARLDGGPAFRVGVPLLDESHFQVSTTPRTRGDAEDLVEALMIRVLSYFRPGTVEVHVWDVGQLRGSLPGLYPLTRTGLLTVHDPTAPEQLLDVLSDRIRRVQTRVLVGGHPSLRALADATGVRSEPWIVAVLLGNRQALRDTEHRHLQRIARGGLAAGISLVTVDLPVALSAAVESVSFTDPAPGHGDGGVRSSMTGTYLGLEPDPVRGRLEITDAASTIADAHEEQRGRLGPFAAMFPLRGQWYEESSVAGVEAPIGFDGGIKVNASLNDATPHALVGGPSGSGKTNLLVGWISALASRYSHDELEFYLLDFKEGVSFAQFAPQGTRSPAPGDEDEITWLPHARLIGININTDREFGLALLRSLAEKMRRRAEACREARVTKIAELRALDPDANWPRIVAVIDEFQFLFSEADAVTKEATRLLEDVARRGRSQGIHMVLASQDVAGIEAFWGRPAIFEQFVLRIALPRARRVLANLNEAAMELPRFHALVNDESGMPHGNHVARIPDASSWDPDGEAVVDWVRKNAHEAELVRSSGKQPPRPTVFDGAQAPPYAGLARSVLDPRRQSPVTIVGQSIDVDGTAAKMPLPDIPGRNLGVIASGTEDALKVLGSAACVLADQGPAQVYLADLVPDTADSVALVQGHLEHPGRGLSCDTIKPQGFGELIERLAGEVRTRQGGRESAVPIYLVLFGADAADGLLDRSGTEALRSLLRFGPENGLHVLGWWRSAQRLKSLLTMGAAMDDLGAWIALDVQGSELNAFAPGMGLAWSPRPGRGLFFDRAHHANPHVVFVPDWPGPGGPVPAADQTEAGTVGTAVDGTAGDGTAVDDEGERR